MLRQVFRAWFGVDREPNAMVKQQCPTCGRPMTFKSWRGLEAQARDAYVKGLIEVDGLERMLDMAAQHDGSTAIWNPSVDGRCRAS